MLRKDSTANFAFPDPVRAFRDAMLAAGIGAPPHFEGDGRIHRFRGEGDKPAHLNCWYVLHLDRQAAGAFGSWRTGQSETWNAGGSTSDPLDAARIATLIRTAQAKAQADREQAQRQAAKFARGLWARSEVANAAHPYLLEKGVPPLTLRQSGGKLLVPLCDLDGVIWNLQRVYPDGKKRFLRDGRVSGLSSIIGELDGIRLLICEGWATGATLYLESGVPVLCAMNAGNLLRVAKAARARWPRADIVICGDDDPNTPGNPGRKAATEAAAAIGARLAFPVFAPGERGTDFNDMAANRRRAAE